MQECTRPITSKCAGAGSLPCIAVSDGGVLQYVNSGAQQKPACVSRSAQLLLSADSGLEATMPLSSCSGASCCRCFTGQHNRLGSVLDSPGVLQLADGMRLDQLHRLEMAVL